MRERMWLSSSATTTTKYAGEGREKEGEKGTQVSFSAHSAITAADAECKQIKERERVGSLNSWCSNSS